MFDLNGPTPQHQHRLREIARCIRSGSVTTWQIMWLFLQLRDQNTSQALREWGDSVAHTKRDRGDTWNRAVRIWATNLYFRYINSKETGYLTLPVHIYDTVISFINDADQYEIDQILKYDLSVKYSKAEILNTFLHAYHRPKGKEYVTAVCENILMDEDPVIISRFIEACETRVLNTDPIDLENIVDDIQHALLSTDVIRRPLHDNERENIQAHILVAFHHTLVDLNLKGYSDIFNESLTPTPLLTVSFHDEYVKLELGYFSLNKYGVPEAEPLLPEQFKHGFLSPTFSMPLMKSSLKTQKWAKADSPEMFWDAHRFPVEVSGNKILVINR